MSLPLLGKDVVPVQKELLRLPEKVLQFGTGVLLRGLCDDIIDEANQQGIFNGRIIIVKSTTQGSIDTFHEQQGLYTVLVRGWHEGQAVEENFVNSSISRVLEANTSWNNILDCARLPDLQVIISNTTEVGITYTEEDIFANPPSSFPAKLLAFLYRRFQVYEGAATKGMVIIPTELIPDNGQVLKNIVIRLAQYHRLPEVFMHWLDQHNYFCNSLVDRIVPGQLPAEKQAVIEQQLGYRDQLMLMCESYRLWAIETDREQVRQVLDFHRADPHVVIANDIKPFRTLKLRLLNGSHTFSCGLACLAGFATVLDAMNNDRMRGFISRLMFEEIVPVITDHQIGREQAENFAHSVLQRFSNPFIQHAWLNITLQYSTKMRMRNVPLLQAFCHRHGYAPKRMSAGFAAHLLFMRGERFVVKDDNAYIYGLAWHRMSPDDVAYELLSNEVLWGTDLTDLPGFAESVINHLTILMKQGPIALLQQID